MQIAIISDIHSNLEALQKTVEIIHTMNINTVVCLGDIVGYGANPKECIKTVSELTPYIMMGNHDQASADIRCLENFTPYARVAAVWTNNILSESEREKLLSLPMSLEIEGITFVHASPYKPDEWNYIATEEEAFFNFQHMKTDICFIGHSHIAKIYTNDYDSMDTYNNSLSTKLTKGKKYIINPGSVGQPRDLDWRSSFGIFDTITYQFEFVRSEYNVKTAANKILAANLPKYLADRILIGR